MTTPADDRVSIDYCATYLKVSDKTVRRMIARGDLDAVRLGARLIRVKRSSLEALGSPLGTATR